MNLFLKIITLFLLIFTTTLSGSQKETKNIAKLSSSSLYNIDKNSLQKTINAYIQTNSKLQALKIVEALSGETYYQMYKQDGNIYFDKPFPTNINQHKKFTVNSKYENETVGKIIAYYKKDFVIQLTQKEKEWIQNNPKVNIIEFFDEPPFTLNNTPKQGYMYELVEYLVNAVGLQTNYINGFKSYGEMLQAIESKKADILTTYPTSLDLGEKSNVIASKSVLKTPFVIIGKHTNKTVNKIEDLFGKKVAVVKGYAQDKYLSKFPKIKKLHVKNNQEGFDAIRSGKADYYVNNRANTEYVLNKNFMTDLKIHFELHYNDFPPLSISFAMNKQNKMLVSILKKSLEQVPFNEIKKIKNQWIISSISEQKLSLTHKEINWLKKHPNITLGADKNWQPFDFKDRFGKHAGFNADLLKLIRKKLGIEIKVELGKWSELQQKVKNKKLAGLVGPAKTIERDKYMEFTQPYFFLTQVILQQKNTPSINSLEQLNGQTLAVKSGSSNIEHFQKNYPNIKLKVFDTYTQIIRAVSLNEVDVGISNIGAASYEMERNFISNIKVGFDLRNTMSDLRFGIRKDWPELASILQKAIDSITEAELNILLNKWLKLAANKNTTKQLELTKEEKLYLEYNPTIRLAYMNFWPTDDAKNNIHTEYVNLLSKYGNININLVKYDNWKEGFNAAQNGVNIQGILNLSWSEDREKFSFDYTKPYYYTPSYLIVKENNNKIKSLKDLENSKIYLKENSITNQIIKERDLNIKPILLKSDEEILKALAGENPKADAFLTYSLTNVIDKYELKVAQKEYSQYGEVHIGVSKTHKELHSIINKIFHIIPKNELSHIQNKTYKKSKKSTIQFTNKEQDWINNNIVTVGVENWAPVVFSSTGNDIDGIAGDIFKLIAQKSGLKYKVVNDLWDPLLQGLKTKKIDILPATYYTDERATYGLYTSGYFNMLDYIYVKETTNNINSLKDLEGKTLAIPKGFGTIPKIEKKFPNIKIINTIDLSDSIKRVLSGEIDALYDGQVAVEYKIQENLVTGLKSIPQNSFEASPLHLFIRDDKVILQSILQKTLDSISPKEINVIKSNWLFSSNTATDNKLQNLKQELNLTDLLPIKEILLGFIVFLIIFYLIWKHQIQTAKKDFALKGTLFIIVGVFLLLASIITILTINNIEKAQKNEIQESLKTVLNGSYQTIKLWTEAKFRRIDIILDNQDIRSLISNLNEDETNLEKLNTNLKLFEKVFEDSEYYLLSPDIQLLTSNVDNFKDTKLLEEIKQLIKKNKTFHRYLLVPSKNESFTQENLLFIKPIKKDLDIIAYIVMKVDPQKEFSKILQNGRLGISGETYAFNENLQLVSTSRFEKDLQEQGVLETGKTSFLNITLKHNNQPTKMAQSALDKTAEFDTDGYKDYRGIQVYGSWIWDDELHLGFTTEIDESEAMGAFNKMKKTIIIIVFSIILFSVFLTILVAWISTKSRKSLQQANKELNKLLESFDENVIASRSDLRGRITYASKAFADITGYTVEELLGKPHSTVRHPDTPKEVFKDLWVTIQTGKIWRGEIKNRKKDGGYYWVDAVITPEFDDEKNVIGYSAIRQDITDQKKVEELSESLELKVIERTKELEDERTYINAIMNSQTNIVISSDGKCLRTANKAFLDFFNVKDTDEFIKLYGDCICDVFDTDLPDQFIQKMMGEEKWLDYVYERPNVIHKAKITWDNSEHIFTISADKFTFDNQELKTAVFTDISELEKIRQEIEQMHKHTQSSIEYASLIQHSLIPENDLFRKYFDDYLTIWHPKDIVGGDIYLFDELRNDNECLLVVIDCTGHGVPGAFVTMLVKAIERQIAAIIGNNPHQEVSPAWILQYFNHTMKHLLKQESDEAISNAGFDGGVLYYNKKENIIKFAGAEIPLFYLEPGESEYKVIKGDRHSIGYKKSDADYQFKDHIITAKEGMQFYLTTDGYIDQNGGNKGFPFGKRKFKSLLEEYAHEPFADQQEVLLDSLAQYQKDEERNDDITVVGIKVGQSTSTNNTTELMWSI